MICECGWHGVSMCMGGAYVLYMRLALIGKAVGLGEKLVRYNWLVRKLIIPLCVCRKSVPSTIGKRIFFLTTSCTRYVLSLIAMERVAVPNAIRGLSFAPETENWIGCSGGMEDSD